MACSDVTAALAAITGAFRFDLLSETSEADLRVSVNSEASTCRFTPLERVARVDLSPVPGRSFLARTLGCDNTPGSVAAMSACSLSLGLIVWDVVSTGTDIDLEPAATNGQTAQVNIAGVWRAVPSGTYTAGRVFRIIQEPAPGLVGIPVVPRLVDNETASGGMCTSQLWAFEAPNIDFTVRSSSPPPPIAISPRALLANAPLTTVTTSC